MIWWRIFLIEKRSIFLEISRKEWDLVVVVGDEDDRRRGHVAVGADLQYQVQKLKQISNLFLGFWVWLMIENRGRQPFCPRATLFFYFCIAGHISVKNANSQLCNWHSRAVCPTPSPDLVSSQNSKHLSR